MNTRLKKIFKNNLITNHCNSEILGEPNNNDNKKHLVIPYVHKISEIIAFLIDRFECIVSYKDLNKLSEFIKVQKDKSVSTSSNNVYKVNCNNCNVSYVGQTKRQLKTRVKKHVNNIKLESSRHSVITNHILNLSHTFDWSNVKILGHEPNYNKRLVSEMFHIKEQKSDINSQKDTELLDEAYYCLLDAIFNKV